MNAEVTLNGTRYAIGFDDGIDLCLPVAFADGAGPRPHAFNLPLAHEAAIEAGTFVGDTARGGSVNCKTLTLTPHGNGTHTECVGHIVDDAISVLDAAPARPVVAVLLTVAPATLAACGEGYGGTSDAADRVITRAALAAAKDALGLTQSTWASVRALIVRSETESSDRAFSGLNPPYPTQEATAFLLEHQIDHVVLEVPSLDREDDGGHTANHHAFFGIEEGVHVLTGEPAKKTVTEMARVPASARDGLYLLDLQVAPLVTDAAPSRPLLFPLRPLDDEDFS